MNKVFKIVMDADGIIAQADSNDRHHKTANLISTFLVENKAQVFYPATAIVEATTYMQRILNSNKSAYSTALVFTDPQVKVAEVDKEMLTKALLYFNPKSSKKNTLFDCIVAAIAEEYQADAIFSFDKFYTKQGFTLAKDLKL